MKRIVLIITAAALAAACGREPEPERLPAALRIEPVITRATEVDFETGDRIGLTVTKGDGSIYAENALLGYDGAAFSGDLDWYSGDDDPCSLKAYYPYSKEGFPSSFTVAEDQRGGAGANDLMFALKRNVKPQEEPVTMVFRHQLSRILMTLDNPAGIGIESITLKGLHTKVYVSEDADCEGIVTMIDENGPKSDIVMEEVKPGLSYRAIVPPQMMSFGVSVRTRSGASLVQDFTEVTMKPGYSYTIKGKVSSDGISFTLSGEITAWDDGGTLEPGGDVPAEPEYEEHDGWFSYAGLRYDTVTLSNGQVWMATPLAYLPSGLSVSDDPSSGSVWYPYRVVDKAVSVLKDEASVNEMGYLYSYDAIFGKHVDGSNYDIFEKARGICPPGWHVPTRAEWYAICGYSTASKYLGESGAQTDPGALFWDKEAGYAPVGAFMDAGFRSLLTGCIANNAYNVLTIDASVCSVEDYFGRNRMAYFASSSPNSATQMFAAMTTFTSTLTLGRVSLGFATLGKVGLQVRCIKD